MEYEIILTEFGKEIHWCSKCDHRVEFGNTFNSIKCANCGTDIKPCHLCKYYYTKEGCNSCFFDKQ